MFWKIGFFIQLILIIAMVWVFIKANPMKNEGAASWIDIYSKDPAATIKFLNDVFGTQVVETKASETPGMDYKVLKAKGQMWPFAGIMEWPEKDFPSHTMIYLTTKDYAATHKKMIELGATPVMTDKYAGGMKFGIYGIPGRVYIGIAEWKER
ncbi:MAG: hypothetical protein LBG89_02850 [Rickettsiales bacterium]|jgi:predicted enzyme related to lactoylglutathione lyase|nr:hypothetical protein [Rickettsiales bacterium]